MFSYLEIYAAHAYEKIVIEFSNVLVYNSHMRFIPRLLETPLKKAARMFPSVILTGPRRSGKTMLLKRMFPGASYHLLEDPDVVARLREDPRSFLESLRKPVILDEIQNAPELLNYVRTQIDQSPSRKGQWLITGSQEAPLMKGVTESMAGRAAILQLFPFSLQESSKVSLFKGGFPEVIASVPSHIIGPSFDPVNPT